MYVSRQESALERGTVCRCSVRREHEPDRQLEQRPESVDDLLAGNAPAQPLIQRDVYPVIFLDCLVLKIREGGSVQRPACYLALGVRLDGGRDVLGMWSKRPRAPSSGCRS